MRLQLILISHQHYSLFLLIVFIGSHWAFDFHFLDEQ